MTSLRLAVLLVASLAVAHAQDAKPLYRTGAFFLTGFPPGISCPIFVGGMYPVSPATQAGLQPGDILVSIDGRPVKNLEDTSRLTSASPGPVTIGFLRGTTSSSLTIPREEYSSILRQNGLKSVQGLVIDLNTTDAEVSAYLAEVKTLEQSMRAGDSKTGFTDHHYPVDKSLYYPGFEVFVWNQGTQITVGGIEQGPAQRSGVRWGDRILAINGIDPLGKSTAELESLLSSSTRKPMTLIIERAGTRRTYSFAVERASDVLADNGKRVADGKIVPSWTPDKYLPCFEH